jgi:hypothetical protein
MPTGKRATGFPVGRRRHTLPSEAEQQAAYLAALATDGTMRTGCKDGHVRFETVLKWREHDDTFVLRENQVKSEFADALEAEAVRRALVGYDRPIYQRGELVGYERVYSDMLLKLLLTAYKPEKFRERVDVSGTVEQVVRQVVGFNPSDVL